MGHGKRRYDTPSPSPSRRRRRSDTPSPSSGHDHHRKRSMTSPSAGADRDNSAHRDHQPRSKSRSVSPKSQDVGGRDCSSPESGRAKKERKKRKKEQERRGRRDGDHRKKKRRKHRSRASASPLRDRGREDENEDKNMERESSTEGPGETGHVTAGRVEDAEYHARETVSMVRAAPTAVQVGARQQREAGASTSTASASPLVLHEVTDAGQGAEKKCEECPVLDEDAPTPPGSPAVSETFKVVQPPQTSPSRSTSHDGECIVLDEDAPTPPGSPTRSNLKEETEGREDPKPSEGAPVAPGVSRASFFAQLVDTERRKGTVGTMHAKGRGDTTGSKAAKSGDWECQKCGKTNYKNASACDR